MNLMQNLQLSEDYLLGKDLSVKRDFFEKFEHRFLGEDQFEQKIKVFKFIGKRHLSLCFDPEYVARYDDAIKIIDFFKNYFVAEGKRLRQLGCCVNYIIDRSCTIEFIFVNVSTNHRYNDGQVVDFKPCNCFFFVCVSILE